MLGFNFPKLFYGRLTRQRRSGCRADFCEFCVCVCRHDVISFDASPAILFIPIKFEEFKRESRCEICRTQFPLAIDSEFERDSNSNQNVKTPISKLIATSNPTIVKSAVRETGQMLQRAGDDSFLTRQRFASFLQAHQDEYRMRMRSFGPIAAVGTIQAALLGLGLSFLAPIEISLGVAVSLYCFVILVYLLSIRRKIYQSFSGRIDRVLSLTGTTANDAVAMLDKFSNRFPNATFIFKSQLHTAMHLRTAHENLTDGIDYISTIENSLCK